MCGCVCVCECVCACECACVHVCVCVCVCMPPSKRTVFLNFNFCRKGEQMVCVLKSDIPRSTRTSSCASKWHRYIVQDFSLHTRLDHLLFEPTIIYSCSVVPRSTGQVLPPPKTNCTETQYPPREKQIAQKHSTRLELGGRL